MKKIVAIAKAVSKENLIIERYEIDSDEIILHLGILKN